MYIWTIDKWRRNIEHESLKTGGKGAACGNLLARKNRKIRYKHRIISVLFGCHM